MFGLEHLSDWQLVRRVDNDLEVAKVLQAEVLSWNERTAARLVTPAAGDTRVTMGDAAITSVFFEFRSVELSDLVWSDQIHALMRAGVLVGTHGGGLANQIWMEPDGRSAVAEVMHNVVSVGCCGFCEGANYILPLAGASWCGRVCVGVGVGGLCAYCRRGRGCRQCHVSGLGVPPGRQMGNVQLRLQSRPRPCSVCMLVRPALSCPWITCPTPCGLLCHIVAAAAPCLIAQTMTNQFHAALLPRAGLAIVVAVHRIGICIQAEPDCWGQQ